MKYQLQRSIAPIELGRPLRLMDFALPRDKRLPVLARVWIARWRRKHGLLRQIIAVRRASAQVQTFLDMFAEAENTITNPEALLRAMK